MKIPRFTAFAAVALVANLAGSISANAQAALVNVVHGINGTDLGVNEAYVVDIAVDGSCDLPDVSFRDIARDLPLDSGKHEIEIYQDDPLLADCAGTLIVTGRIDLADGENASLVAHLNQSGVPAITKVSNNVADMDPTDSRLAIVHAAVAPPVDIFVQVKRKKHGKWQFSNNVRIDGLRNGEQSFPTDVSAEKTWLRVSPDSNSRKLFAQRLMLDPEVSYTVFAVGTPANDTFEFLVLDILE